MPPGLTANFKAYATTIDALRANGVTVFASSGNGGSRLSMTAPACIHDAVAVGAVYSRSSDALLSLLKSTGVPIVDPRNGLTTPRIDLAAALGVVLGRPVPPLPSGPAAGPIISPPLSATTAPHASFSMKPISFGSVTIGRTAIRKLVVRNTGTGYLTVRIATTLASVSASPARVVIPAARSATAVLPFRPRRAGSYRGELRLRTDDPSMPSIALPVRGTGAA